MSDLSVTNIWQSAKLREKLIIAIGLLYILLPFDIIPEIVLGPLGLLDDGGALLAVILTLTAVIKRQRKSKNGFIEQKE